MIPFRGYLPISIYPYPAIEIMVSRRTPLTYRPPLLSNQMIPIVVADAVVVNRSFHHSLEWMLYHPFHRLMW